VIKRKEEDVQNTQSIIRLPKYSSASD